MAEPRVPGGGTDELDLPCGRTVRVGEFDMGLREFDCDCGAAHAVVVDVHPLGRFVPESMADVLRATIEPADEYPEFSTPHLLGIVVEEFPERVVSADVSEDESLGFGLLWVAEFDARRLHEVVVELLVELMEHAMSHADDESAMSEFESQMGEFDVAEFVDAYRRERDFESEHDTAV